MTKPTFRLVPRGPYSLAASSTFLCGFTPAKGGSTRLDDGRLVLGFLDDVHRSPVSVALEQRDDGEVVGELSAEARGRGIDLEAIASQVARVLSLDHDASNLELVAKRDRALGALLEAMPGFRPVCFPSPYEAAVWAVLAQRISMAVAAGIKQRLARATGTIARGFGCELTPTPSPRRLLELRSFEGISAEKLTRLQAVAVAALEGKLDATRIRSLPHEEAIDRLRAIRGVGAWTAEHIVMRGSGAIDEMPCTEPRVLRGIAEAYGMGAIPTVEEALHIAESWRPYRMWIAVLLVMNLASTSRSNGPEVRGARGAITKRVSSARRTSPMTAHHRA
jgi:DNA-3-methyladenine glycosylase II